MERIRTHYDNLKVARDAPPEVIRAAYKTLSQKYHPDRNLGSDEATRVMAVINASYDVLSDPVKRKRHDLWIQNQELSTSHIDSAPNPQTKSTASPPSHSTSGSNEEQDVVLVHLYKYWAIYLVIGFFIWLWGSNKDKPRPNYQQPYQASQVPIAPKQIQESSTPATPKFIKPTFAPNGSNWPINAGYVYGYEVLHADGLSTVTVDNSKNDSDVFVKLTSLDDLRAYSVRQFFIPAFGIFTLDKVRAGKYDIRYRDLENGVLSRSEPFELEEMPTDNGRQFSNLTMTLYKVQNGNMKTYRLPETDF